MISQPVAGGGAEAIAIDGADTGGLPLGSYTGVLTFTFAATF